MGFARGGKGLLHAYVELLVSNHEPHASSTPQRLGLDHLGQAEQLTEELARIVLAPLRGGELDVVESHDVQVAHCLPYGWPQPLSCWMRVIDLRLLRVCPDEFPGLRRS